MAKSAKHKKLRRQEKAKTQLTGVKKLAKAQNVVEPTLKTKKIVVREQLKHFSEEVAYTRKKQNLQDILSSLNHHNSNIKKGGLNGLTELIAIEKTQLAVHLDRILAKVAALTADEDSSVRKENLKVAELIFSRINENQMQPFWNLLLTQLKCTLTSLNSVIRYSCLNFLQLLISYFPNLVSCSVHTILPSLLWLISSSITSRKTSNVTVSKIRLKVEISEKHSDIRERLRVLSLMATCLDLQSHALDAVVREDKETKSASKTSIQNNHAWNDDKNIFLSLYYPQCYEYTKGSQNDSASPGPTNLALNTSGSNIAPIFNSSFTNNNEKSSNQFWSQFIHSSLQILCETWVEVGPSLSSSRSAKNHSEMDSDVQEINGGRSNDFRGAANLSKDAVEVLTCIMSVMKHLIKGSWSYDIDDISENRNKKINFGEKDSAGVEDDLRSMRKMYGHDLTKHFFQWLPFSAIQDSQRPLITNLNLQLFQVAAQLRLVDSKMMVVFKKYLKGLMKRGLIDKENTTVVLKILCCLHLPGAGKLSTEFIRYGVQSEQRGVVLNYLIRMVHPSKKHLNEMSILESISWDELCPQIMKCSPVVTPELLKLFTLISIRKLSEVRIDVENNVAKFADYAKNQNTVEVWDETIRLFYYCNAIDTFMKYAENIPACVLKSLSAL